MSDNGNKWDRNQILTLIGVIIAAATLVASVVIPEIRNCFSLKDGNTPAPVLPTPIPQPEPDWIYGLFIRENKSWFIEEVNVRLSATFHVVAGEQTASITIVPAGKQAIVRPVLNGYTEEFTSSTGAFLVHVLNVDWKSRTITVQVSQKI